jgi:hypothetical protein
MPGHPGHQGVDEAWDRFVITCQRALGKLVEGRPEPFKALWSHADDVVIMGALRYSDIGGLRPGKPMPIAYS